MEELVEEGSMRWTLAEINVHFVNDIFVLDSQSFCGWCLREVRTPCPSMSEVQTDAKFGIIAAMEEAARPFFDTMKGLMAVSSDYAGTTAWW